MSKILIVSKVSKFVFFILPIGVTCCAFVFGFLLSITEGWPFDDCFWIMVGEVTQLDIEMVDRDYKVTKLPGKIAASLCGVWCLGFLAVIIGISGNLLILPAIKPDKVNKYTTMDPSMSSPSSFAELQQVYDDL